MPIASKLSGRYLSASRSLRDISRTAIDSQTERRVNINLRYFLTGPVDENKTIPDSTGPSQILTDDFSTRRGTAFAVLGQPIIDNLVMKLLLSSAMRDRLLCLREQVQKNGESLWRPTERHRAESNIRF